MHLTGNVIAYGKAYIYFYKGVTISTSGTVITPVNMNDTSSNASTASVYYGGFLTSSGTTWCEVLSPGAPGQPGGKSPVGSEIRQDTEFVLKANTNYALYVKNILTTSYDHNINLQWYEE